MGDLRLRQVTPPRHFQSRPDTVHNHASPPDCVNHLLDSGFLADARSRFATQIIGEVKKPVAPPESLGQRRRYRIGLLLHVFPQTAAGRHNHHIARAAQGKRLCSQSRHSSSARHSHHIAIGDHVPELSRARPGDLPLDRIVQVRVAGDHHGLIHTKLQLQQVLQFAGAYEQAYVLSQSPQDILPIPGKPDAVRVHRNQTCLPKHTLLAPNSAFGLPDALGKSSAPDRLGIRHMTQDVVSEHNPLGQFRRYPTLNGSHVSPLGHSLFGAWALFVPPVQFLSHPSDTSFLFYAYVETPSSAVNIFFAAWTRAFPARLCTLPQSSWRC